MSETITIDSGLEYTVYAGLETANVYVEAAFGAGADAWRDATDLTKQRALVSATRRFEATKWCGEQASSSQDLAWPRSGLTDIEGDAVADDAIPQEVIDANIELALDIILGTTQANKDAVDANIRRLKADVAEIEYFRASSASKAAFPETVRRLIGRWLCGADEAASIAYGTDGKSNFDNDFDVNQGF